MMKMRQDKDVSGRTSPLFAENEIELSWSIRQSTVDDEL